ncbi:MAG: ORF6N domain-containing protein [Chitinophagaceae bacterium]
MAKEKKTVMLADEAVISKIYAIRRQKVMLDRDLAAMYNVTTGNLNKAVKRNLKRFPEDFMFQLTDGEFKDLMFRNGISSQPEGKAVWGGTRKMPYAFTEQGVSMLSSVLNSDIAIEVNIRIIRIFTKLREMVSTHKDILLKLEQLERKVTTHDEDIKMIFKALKQLLNPPQEPRRKIGFRRKEEQD